MRFDRIRLRNFKPYDEVDLRLAEGVTVIHGPNGAGKSSLLEACFFGLYGAKAIDGTLDDVVTNGTDETKVELWFTHDGSTYHVLRELKRYSGDVGTRTCVLDGDGLEDPIDGATDVRSFVTDLLRMDSEAFVNCAYVRQGEVNKLINATPRARQRMIDDLLQLGKLEEYRERAGDARLGVEDVLGEKRGSLETVQSQIEAKEERNLEARLNARESELSSVEDEIERFEDNREKAEQTLDRANEVLDTYEERREELAELEVDVDKLETAVEEGQREREELADEITDIEGRVANLEATIEDRVAETELNRADEETIEARRDDLDDRESHLRDRLQEIREEETETRGSLQSARERVSDGERLLEQGKCPECGQPVDESPRVDTLEEERQRVARLEEAVAELETKREELETELDELETKREHLAELQELQTEIDEARQRIETLEERRESRADLIKERRERLAEKRERRDELRDSFDEERVQEARNRKENAQEYLEKVEEKLEELSQRRSDLQAEIGGIRQDMDELERLKDRHAALEEEVEVLETVRDEASELEALYGDLRAELRQQNVESLERTLNETFELVYGNDAYSRIDLDGEYQLTVYQKDGEALDPEQLSGGERALFNLSLRCAIYRLLAAGIDGTAPTPPLILDEPTVFLDSGHVSRLVELVEEMRGFGVAQIIIVSHDDELAGAADELVQVEKDPTTNRSTVHHVDEASIAGLEPGTADD